MSKLSLILFGSPLADIATRAVRRITVGAVGAVVAVLLLVIVNSYVPIPKDWGWVPVVVVLLFSLWCLWHLAVGMHLAAQWLGLIAERPVRFATEGRGVSEAGSASAEQDAADAIALSDNDDDPTPRRIAATEGPMRAGTEKWRQREEAAQASTPRPRPAEPASGRSSMAQRAEGEDAEPPPLNRRVIRELNTKSDDDTVDEDA